ncbi:hypothetical protein BRE01_67290 [Brevibacillus reuszeri]|uniref:Zinc/iron-chelating domain-containing protein n=1 Tax=Brevibacillus reuszeri TaxID=54915 RepID=A0A0K9YPS4_9BACL|nr:YkgJ family cysteine cluster protein [Brevibacillus reuszeri]KNB70180.1 hypothetical protein ADS79_14515 [Brevibacillus reuszeri]GED73027.1 hypothetical protein BRE01_67290 [Brevibacillus reuszeri]
MSERNSTCFCGSGKKYKKCHSDVLPESRAGILIKLYSELNETVNDYYTHQIEKPPCQKGCSSCCYQNFAISFIEAKLIMKELRKWSRDELNELMKITHDQIEYLKINRPDVYRNLEEDSTGRGAIFFEQIRIMGDSYGLPCPLLNVENGACRIYEIRPAICRTHGVSHRSDNLEDVEICEHIPSSKENSKRTPDIAQFTERIRNLSTIEYELKQMPIRMYPIVYWLKMMFNAYERFGEIVIPFEDREFSMSKTSADKMQGNDLYGRRR